MKKNKITAVLGPTNTGKTFLAIETMLSFDTGMMGFPLRLLAREVYDKVIKKVDPQKVALITGEEKIIPANAKYYFCTVESMPVDKILEFVGIDEIQMCSDHERGHIFTDRLLNLRGEKLTMFMGSNSMRNIIEKLEEDIEYIDRKRLSKLTYSGHKKISRIERKSAIIAFSAEEVYAIAELIRRQKGGAAIVMGSLSPKTRNSQVSLYQSGDVDYLVATDAIGMGINMDLNNVYFSNLKKFDGKKLRRLKLSEISQIAGRAGRYLNDGSFGITGDCGEISAEEIELLENHKIDEIHTIFWRNPNLNFKNGDKLIKSLEERPNKSWLRKVSECEDEKVLKYILKDTEKLQIFNNENELKLLWECCQIPDFVKKTYGNHLEVVGKVFNFLRESPGKITSKYMKQQLSILDKLDGNVDSVSNRIANVRTWSYVANKNGWVENQDYWVERTKFLEDRLSDRLHEELTKSFIDKKISILSRSLKQDLILNTKIDDESKIYIDEQFIGELKGLKFLIELTSKTLDTDIKSIKKAARKGIEKELIKRVDEILTKGEININNECEIIWKNNRIARLKKGNDYLSPEIDIIADDSLVEDSKIKLISFLNKWLSNYVNEILGDLIKLSTYKISNQYLRGLVFQLYENNGVVKREEVQEIVKLIPTEDRKKLWGMGIKIGRYHIYLPKMLKPKAVEFRINLWKIFHNFSDKNTVPKSGLNFLCDVKYEKNFLLLCGFEKFREFYVRIDILEKLFLKIIENTKDKKFKTNAEMMNLLGCSKENFYKLMNYMNYKKDKLEDTYVFLGEKRKKKKIIRFDKKENPFKKLLSLNLNK